MGILLYIIATILWIILTPINWFIVCIKHGLSNAYFLETAVDIDKFGNRNFRTFLNATMRLRNGYKFGNVNETISSVFSKKKKDKSLTYFGLFIFYF